MKLVLVLAVAACGPSGPPTTPQPPKPDPVAIDLTMRVRAEHEGKKFGVAPGDSLRTGDFLEMYVDLSTPAYLYVVQFFPDGTSAVLFPDHGDRLVPQGNEIRIPDAAQSFQLDEHRGEENVYVVASREPIGRVDAAVAADIDEIRVSGSEGSAAPIPADAGVAAPAAADAGVAPMQADAGVQKRQQHARAKRDDHLLTLATRDLKLVKHGADPALTASMHLRNDVLVVRFTFRHE